MTQPCDSCSQPSDNPTCDRCLSERNRIGGYPAWSDSTPRPNYQLTRREVDPCSEESCSNPWWARGLCRSHYEKMRNANMLHLIEKQPFVTYPNYMTAHNRMKKTQGSASNYECVDCGERARDWSYEGGAPDERPSKYGPYSYDTTYYKPRCGSCHQRRDSQKDECPRGHLYAEVGRNTQRRCRQCDRDRARAYYWAKKGVAA